MSNVDATKAPPKGVPSFGSIGRRAVSTARQPLVETGPLSGGGKLPLVLRPVVEGVDLVEWAESHRQEIEDRLLEHRGLLFRGFAIRTVEDFQRFVAATKTGDLLEYRDRSTPRHTVGAGIYVSTVYPSAETINMHNEGTYWRSFPLKIWFCSLKAAQEGGETPIADVRNVLARLDPEVRERFRRTGVLYVRNYNDGIGLPWQEVFQTDSRNEVEEYCRKNGIETEWKGDGRLRTRQIRPAVRRHPKTGEEVWFNHAAFFHVTSLEPAMREALLADFGVEGLPYNTYYGDGTPIEPEVVEQIQAAYRAEMVVFPWEPGDVLLLDNLTVAHGRRPYTGERQVVVAMAEPQSGLD